MKELGVVVCQSDKGKQLVVCSREAYLEMGLVHTRLDKEVSMKEVLEAQRKLTGNSRSLGNIFGA